MFKKMNVEIGIPLVSEEDPMREKKEVDFAAAAAAAAEEEVTARAIGE